MRPLRVFLCHASQDKPAVRELHNALKAEGWIDPWLDKAKILPGQDWEMVIEKAVDDSDVVIVCLSGQSVTKEGFVQREIRYAYDIALEKPEETIFLIPLRLDDCIVPRKLRTLHWVDYFGVDKENTYSDLLKALKLRYEQILRLEADELERRQAEDKSRREAEELVRRLVVEQSAREKTAKEAKEKEDREAAEKIAREKKDREGKEKIEREVAENDAREKREREAREKAAREARKKKEQRPNQGLGIPIFTESYSDPDGDNSYEIPDKGKSISKSVLVNTNNVRKTEKKQPVVNLAAIGVVGFLLIVGVFVTLIVLVKLFLPITNELGIGSTIVSEKDGMVLVYVPVGEFTMGSDSSSDEQPIHQVDLDAFWIDQTEVTNAMYAICVLEDECDQPGSLSSYTHDSYFGNPEFDDYPVINVSWEDAKTYCLWADRRLPTEVEWEKAARGTDGNIYPWGDAFDGTKVNFCDSNCSLDWAEKSFNDGYADVSPVGKYPSGQSIYGALDMAGNVWEWVADWYSETYYQSAPSSNPLGPNTGTYRVFRGGSWLYSDNDVRSALRSLGDPTGADFDIGFRCARSP